MDIIAVRQDLWRLRLIDRALLVTNLGFVAAVIVTVFILRHLDQVYVLMTLYGSLSSVLRFFVWKVRAVPAPLLTLAHGTPDQRDAAWRLITEHRDELPPYAERNAVKALAALWQVANGAGLQPGPIYETGA